MGNRYQNNKIFLTNRWF